MCQEKALKAQFSLLVKARNLHLPADITCELFTKTILPVLKYGCEVWGFSDLEQIDIFHIKGLRSLLKYFEEYT